MKRREASSGILAYFPKKHVLNAKNPIQNQILIVIQPSQTESELLTDLPSQSSNQTESQTQ